MSVTDVRARFPVPLKWPRWAMDVNKVDAIVIHHTAVDPQTGEPGLIFPAANMTVEDELNHIAVIHLYHKSRGFGGFGYHLIAFPSGRAYLVTSLGQWGAHVALQNNHLWGIAFAGDFTSRLPDAAQIAGGRDCVRFCYGFIEGLPINPHKAYGGTACPGRLVEILDQLTPQPEEEEMLELAQHTATKAVYALFGPFKIHLSPLANEAMMERRAGAVRLGDTDTQHDARLDALPEYPVGAGGDVLGALRRLKLVVD